VIDDGRRDDLTGSGLIRSAGGWSAVRELKRSKLHIKSDERILGDGDFVSEILSRSEESFERSYALKARGINIDFVAKRVSTLLNMQEEDIWREGKVKELVRARSLLCFWAVRELGISMAAMARRLNISTVAVSKSVARGAELAKKGGLYLI
jgi:putative transposase